MRVSFRNRVFVFLIIVWSLSGLAMTGCGGDDPPGGSGNGVGPQLDTIPPAAVTDLHLRAPTQQSFALVWTAPGDDGATGQAAKYDIRYSTTAINDENWDDAIPVDSVRVPVPKPGGQLETIVVVRLESGTLYFFALKTTDDDSNESKLSNCASGTTNAETDPPANVTDLKATAITDVSFQLEWTAPGDDFMTGTATAYEIRYSIRPITDQTSWDYAAPLSDPPTPLLAGETQTFVATGLPAVYYFFALKAVDELGNWSGMSNQAGALAEGEFLWPTPTSVPRGELVYILYRSSPNYATTVAIHEYGYGSLYCSSRVIEEVVSAVLPDGTYMAGYDFVDSDTGRYLDPGMYHISLCWGSSMVKSSIVYFDN